MMVGGVGLKFHDGDFNGFEQLSVMFVLLPGAWMDSFICKESIIDLAFGGKRVGENGRLSMLKCWNNVCWRM